MHKQGRCLGYEVALRGGDEPYAVFGFKRYAEYLNAIICDVEVPSVLCGANSAAVIVCGFFSGGAFAVNLIERFAFVAVGTSDKGLSEFGVSVYFCHFYYLSFVFCGFIIARIFPFVKGFD